MKISILKQKLDSAKHATDIWILFMRKIKIDGRPKMVIGKEMLK